MQKHLGPRTVTAFEPSGAPVLFVIQFSYEPPRQLSFDDGEVDYAYRGSVEVSAQTEHRSFALEAIDELQLTAFLMKLAFAWIGRVCEDEGLQLYRSTPGDIQTPLDLFT